jgi:O-antigen/teichoic acid export membrane protein
VSTPAAPEASAPGSLRQKTFHATKWATVSSLALQLSRILLYFVLARILGPDTFGLAARVLAVALIFDMASEFGFIGALVQREDLTKRHVDTAFVSNLGFSVAISLAGFVGVHAWAWFSGASEFLDVLQYVMFLPIVFALGHVQRALLMRELDFRSITVAMMAGALVYFVLAVALALAGWGVWAILVGYYVNYLVMAVFYWRGSTWRPKLVFGKTEFWDLASFGFFHAVSKVANALTRGVDVLVIGAALGNVAAGVYSMGLRIGGLAVGQVANVLNSVLFSSFSRLQGDKEKLGVAYLRSTRYLAIVATAALVVTYASASIVPLLLGEDWLSVVPIARILCFSVLWLGLGGTLVPPALTGIGRSDWELVLGLLKVALLAGCLWLGVEYGLVAAAAAVVGHQVLHSVIAQLFVVRGVGIRFGDYVRRVADVFLGFALSAGVIHGLEFAFAGRDGAWWVILTVGLSSLLGVSAYLGVLFLSDRPVLTEVMKMLLNVLRARRERAPAE